VGAAKVGDVSEWLQTCTRAQAGSQLLLQAAHVDYARSSVEQGKLFLPFRKFSAEMRKLGWVSKSKNKTRSHYADLALIDSTKVRELKIVASN
jgi:hypothetical protein